jgi:hypothetical protein
VAFGVAAVLDAVEQLRVAAGAHLGIAEFALGRAFDLAAELRWPWSACRSRCRAPARRASNTACGRLPVLGLVDRVGAAGEDDALRLEVADELLADVEGMQFAIHLLLAHAAGDELRDLRTEIEDEDLLVGHGAGISK